MNELFLAVVLSWSVIDGDTVRVTARAWPSIVVEEHVRLVGVDTPEVHAALQCERDLASAATAFTLAQMTAAKKITVSASSRDSFGRVLGDVRLDGASLSDKLLAAGVARKFVASNKAKWC